MFTIHIAGHDHYFNSMEDARNFCVSWDILYDCIEEVTMIDYSKTQPKRAITERERLASLLRETKKENARLREEVVRLLEVLGDLKRRNV